MHDFKSLFFYWQPVENHIYFSKFVIKILKLNANIYKFSWEFRSVVFLLLILMEIFPPQIFFCNQYLYFQPIYIF